MKNKVRAEYLEILEEDKPIEDLFFLFAWFSPSETGLSSVIWVSEHRGNHIPRIKVQIKKGKKICIKNWATVSIEDKPRLIHGELTKCYFDQVVKWILLNKKILLRYWVNEICTTVLIKELKKLEPEKPKIK